MAAKRDDAIPPGCFLPLAVAAPFLVYTLALPAKLLLVGIGLMLALMFVYSVWKRLAKLEERIDELEARQGAAADTEQPD